jgi:hypothetical protein
MDPKDLTAAIATTLVSPAGFLALALIVLAIVVPRLVEPGKKPHKLAYVVVVAIIFMALTGFSWTVYGNYVSRSDSVFVPRVSANEPAKKPETASSSIANVASRTAQQPHVAAPAGAPVRKDYGIAWTAWIDVGGGVGDPCPGSCTRGAELGQSYRVVGFPPRPQTKHKFQCWRE